ncbi:MAG: hypothetical protein A3I88_02160 [Candidatus Portnoybacteria bacterium RIFCSPLOWO2_12_FULL_39_9]|uniref:Uncharacterized protein n=1 Tax=Candidatus Portnoybacteria bacterium RIFCSPHIGHO2_12_FULL_38_9 TaxID=1801997 RepID=A0A1G2FG26_9BACT|nr:MAG: hypothetical protein A3H00_00960 [Candidatus Portnoybacteria bacterium RBG_13_40_8]OGZ36511.1 MAG: hypothetical protein A3J64_02705 [Candidatus Portnoybacteria bacterium RIFCSPHIGHO2_12_FULL_38_9]OGZ37078.1 MAG: hypothetical protein A2646_00685 [Candidatus Portnoybacteria bacterium RIFCSPHIGHO2_02_FULL_39_12]OGZ38216.1 MAG: hypothetical protein A3F21_01740 [Candidatus Portnoybacteria bacterium RIFCSPLOWO2_01_FULL_38_39]OGZ41301.1 MAG: hypothetical protein A3I88_02160 [Candidatus Portnoy
MINIINFFMLSQTKNKDILKKWGVESTEEVYWKLMASGAGEDVAKKIISNSIFLDKYFDLKQKGVSDLEIAVIMQDLIKKDLHNININKKDKMRITEKTKEYSDEHLLEELVIKIDQYPPEILDILKKEFENRGHDLKKLLLEEYEKSGKIKKIFQKVRHIGVAGEVGSFDKYCIGNLYFTSESIFYLPFKIKSDFRNIGWYGSGFLGYLGTELFSEITAKRKKSFKDDLPEDLPPLSLLSRFIKGSICFKKSEIKKVIAAVVMLPGAIKKFSFKTTNKDNDDSFEIQSRDVEEFRSIIKEEGILLESARGLSKWKTIFLK